MFLPAGINLCYLEPAVNEIFEEPQKWTVFWGSYISALASFAMVAITWKTLRQNKEQLDELKRQWNEQNTPKVFCSLEKSDSELFLFFENVSNCSAADVSFTITTNIEGNSLFKERIALLNRLHLMIPPLHKKIIDLYLPAYVDGQYDSQYIEVTITTNNVTQGTYRLFIDEIKLIHNLDYSSLSNNINKISTELNGIKNKIK